MLSSPSPLRAFISRSQNLPRLLKHQNTATVRANQPNPITMRVSSQSGTEGKVRAN